MPWKCEELQERVLRAASSPEAFQLHLAALDWSLIDPIIINDQEDIKSTNWRDKGLKPFSHQVENLITFCRRLPVALIADDVGLGKTISAGLILSELISRRRVSRALVLCPRVLVSQWVAELDEKFGIVGVEATGAKLDNQLGRSTSVVVTTYESARERLAKIEPGEFDLCILDEAHKLRNLHGSGKPPLLALRVREALERRPFRYVLMLTATPIQNKIWDLYSLIDLLKVAEGKPNPFGAPDAFRARYLEPGTEGRALRYYHAEAFRRLARASLSRTRRTDVQLRFPDRKIQMLPVPLQAAELAMVRTVARHIDGLSALAQVSLAQAMMSSPRALVAQARNMAERDHLPKSAVVELEAAAAQVPMPAKLQSLLDFIARLAKHKPEDWRALVFTVRRETQEMISEALRSRGIACGLIRGASAAANQKSIVAYSQQPPSAHVIVSTDAGAEGVNLQAGNVIINYDLPWNPMIVEQRIGRIQRLGSLFANVIVANLVGKDTVEARIVGRLTEKLQGVAQAIGDIEGILEAADLDEEGDKSFEARIRHMVVAALVGQDTTAATALMEKNIDLARQLFEEQRAELDRTLGNPQEPAGLGPSLAAPRIERKPPRQGVRDFVLGAQRADGFSVTACDADTYELRKGGRALERITFKDKDSGRGNSAAFGGQRPRLCLPGKPAFERIVQHWVDHHAHWVTDHCRMAASAAESLARDWCRQHRLEFVSCSYRPNAPSFQGRIHLRARAGNGVDSFEKILVGRAPRPEGHETLKADAAAEPLAHDLATTEIVPQVSSAIRKAVESDQDIGQFCAFYEARLCEAHRETGLDARRLAKVQSDLQPIVHADIVGIEGIRYDDGEIDVRFQIDGHDYASRLRVVPTSGQFLKVPAFERCRVTQLDWPTDCLEDCEATGETALRHLLARSTSGKWALPEHLVQCSVTGEKILTTEAGISDTGRPAKRLLLVTCVVSGKTLLPDESVKSQLSGRSCASSFAIRSEFSGRIGLPDEVVRCSVTGRTVLKDEAVVAKADGQWYCRDQLKPSAVSGRLAPPIDLVTCERTGDIVLDDEVERCAATGLLVRRDRLVQSVASGRWLLQEAAASTDDGRIALPGEIGECVWQGRRMLIADLATCNLTGIRVDRQLLNAEGELDILRRLLDGSALGATVTQDEAARLFHCTGWTPAKPNDVVRVTAPAANVFAVCVTQRSWLRSKRHLGGVVRFGEAPILLGTAILGQRHGGRWRRD